MNEQGMVITPEVQSAPSLSMTSSVRADTAKAALDLIPTPARSFLSDAYTNISALAKRGMLAAAITEDIADLAAKTMPSVRNFINVQLARQAMRFEHERKIDTIWKAFDAIKNTEERKALNKFIHDSTMEQKWGYAHPGVTVDQEMSQRFNRLTPQAQNLVKAVFQHGEDMLAEKKRVVTDAINSDYAERMKDADTASEKAVLTQQRDLQLSQYNSMLKIQSNGPYAPLKRFGSYIVIAKSKAFIEAEKAKRARDLISMRQDANHYVVQWADTKAQAEHIADGLRPSFAEGKVEAGEKEAADSFRYSNHDMFLAYGKLRKTLEDSFGDDAEAVKSGAYKHMNNMMRDMYLSTLAESSARKSEMRRHFIHGADLNMMRSFVTQGRADAHFLSTVAHGDNVLNAIEAMRKEANFDSGHMAENRPYLNEMIKRHAASLEHRPHRMEDMMKRATSLWMLSTSPSFYLQQITQTYMMSLPEMASRHGYFRSERYLRRAYSDMFKLIEGVDIKGNIDWNKAPADVRSMLTKLTQDGKIDIGLDMETGSAAMQGEGKTTALWNNTDRWLRGLNVRVESINRAVAAMASYRLEMERNNGNQTKATEYAGRVVHITHGSYDGFNTPRALNSAFPGARVIMQFRRFQIIQMSMIARMVHTSLKGASADERWVARKALGFTLGHAMLMGGAMGLPGATTLMYIATKLFGDPDEPDDPELKLRRLIGDRSIADLLLKGAPARMGLDVSGKIGYGNVFSLLPFQDIDLTSKKGYAQTAMAALGPFFGGLMPRMADGVGLIASGNMYKGLEQMLPNGVGNAMKGYRVGNEGVTMRNGDVVIPAEEVDFLDATLQGLGLPTTDFTHRQMAQQNKYEYDTFYREKTTQLLNEYAKAYRNNDAADMQEARDAWMRMEESRARNGYKRQPLSTLLKAPVEQRKRERHEINGVEYNKQNKHFVEDVTTQ